MSKANKLASLAVDVNNLSELADQVTDIENAIVRANTNAQLINGIADDIEALEANTAVIMNDFANISPEAPVLSFRNKIINGNFDIWQRGTSQTTADYGSADRWNCLHKGSTKTASQQAFTVGQTDVPGNPKYYLRHVVSSVAGAGNYCSFIQQIEGVQTLAGQTATLSFWAKADSNKSIATEFRQHFGTGGSPSAIVSSIGVTTHNLTTSWQKFTTTVSIPSISGKTIGSDGNDKLQINFWFDAESNWDSRNNSLGQQSGTFDIAQVQLEEGSVPTPFEHRPIGTELALCQRYYETCGTDTLYKDIIQSYSGGSGSFVQGVEFKVQKRADPTVSIFSKAGTVDNVSYHNNSLDYPVTSVEASTYSIRRIGSSTSLLRTVQYTFTADAEL